MVPRSLPQPGPRLPCILVVEDEPLIRFAIAEALRDEQLTVIEAASADEAWAFAQTGAPIDLVFTDNNLPGSMTGIEFATKLRRRDPAIAIVVTSGRPIAAAEWSGRVVTKPYRIDDTAKQLAVIAGASAERNDE